MEGVAGEVLKKPLRPRRIALPTGIASRTQHDVRGMGVVDPLESKRFNACEETPAPKVK